MKKGDTIPGILVVLFGAFFLITTVNNSQLSFGSVTSDGVPGAGFFPYLLSIGLIIMGILLFIKGIHQKGTIKYLNSGKETRLNFRILGLTMLGLFAFLAFWQLTEQFFIGMFIYVLYLNIVFKRTWKYTIGYGVIFTVFVFLVFSLGFSVQF